MMKQEPGKCEGKWEIFANNFARKRDQSINEEMLFCIDRQFILHTLVAAFQVQQHND